MFIYIFVAALTTTLAAVVDRIDSRIGKVALMAAITLVFCYFAGARDATVGTDTAGYGYQTFLGAKTYPLSVFVSDKVYGDWGFLYKLITWLAANTVGTFGAMLFAIELCIVTPVVAIGYKYTNKHLALAVAVFAIYYYPLSFNLIRQSIAMSFLLPAWYELDQKRVIGYFAWLVIAFLFHSSAVLGLLLLIIWIVAKPVKVSSHIKISLFVFLSLIGLLVMPDLLNTLAPYMHHYSAYMTDATWAIAGHGYRNTIELILAFIALYTLGRVFANPSWMWSTSYINNIEKVDELALVVLFGVIATGISPFSVNLSRVGTYFIYFSILLLPSCLELVPGRTERFIYFFISISVVALLAVDLYVITGQNEVVPYVFSTV